MSLENTQNNLECSCGKLLFAEASPSENAKSIKITMHLDQPDKVPNLLLQLFDSNRQLLSETRIIENDFSTFSITMHLRKSPSTKNILLSVKMIHLEQGEIDLYELPFLLH